MRPSGPLSKALALALCALVLPWQAPVQAWAQATAAPDAAAVVFADAKNDPRPRVAAHDAALKELLKQLADPKLPAKDAETLPKRFGELVLALEKEHGAITPSSGVNEQEIKVLQDAQGQVHQLHKLAEALADAAVVQDKPEQAAKRFSAATLAAVVVLNTPRLALFTPDLKDVSLDKWSELSAAASAMSDPASGVAAAEKILKDDAAKTAPKWSLGEEARGAEFTKAFDELKLRAADLVERWKKTDPSSVVAAHSKATESAEVVLEGVELPKSADPAKVKRAKARMAAYVASGNQADLDAAIGELDGLFDANDSKGKLELFKKLEGDLKAKQAQVAAESGPNAAAGTPGQPIVFSAPKKITDLKGGVAAPELAPALKKKGASFESVSAEWAPKIEEWLRAGGQLAGPAWEEFSAPLRAMFKDGASWKSVLCATTIGCNGTVGRMAEMSGGFMERAERVRLETALGDFEKKLAEAEGAIVKATKASELPSDAAVSELEALLASFKDLWYAKKLKDAKTVPADDASLKERLDAALKDGAARAAAVKLSAATRLKHSPLAAAELAKAYDAIAAMAVMMVNGDKPEKGAAVSWGAAYATLITGGKGGTSRAASQVFKDKTGKRLTAATGPLVVKGGLWTWIEAYEKHNHLRKPDEEGPYVLSPDDKDLAVKRERADVLVRLLVAIEHHRKAGTLDLKKWGEFRQDILGAFASGKGTKVEDLGAYGQAFIKQAEADEEQDKKRKAATLKLGKLPKLSGDFKADEAALDAFFDGGALSKEDLAVLPPAYQQYYAARTAEKEVAAGKKEAALPADAPSKREAYGTLLIDRKSEAASAKKKGPSLEKLYIHYYGVNKAVYDYACPADKDYKAKAGELDLPVKQLSAFCEGFDKIADYNVKDFSKHQALTDLAAPILRKLKPQQIQDKADASRKALFKTLRELPEDARAALGEAGVDVEGVLKSEDLLQVNEWTVRAYGLVYGGGATEADRKGWSTLRDDYLKRTYGDKFMAATDAQATALKSAAAAGDENAIIKALDGIENPQIVTSGYIAKIPKLAAAGPDDRAKFSARDQQIAGFWEMHKGELEKAAKEYDDLAAKAPDESSKKEYEANAALIRKGISDPSDGAGLLEAFRLAGFPVFDARTVRVGMNTGRLKMPAATEEEKKDVFAALMLAKLAGVELKAESDLKEPGNASKIRDWLLGQLQGPVASGQADFRRDQLVLSRNDELNDRLRAAGAAVPDLKGKVEGGKAYGQLERFASAVGEYETDRVAALDQQFQWSKTEGGRAYMTLPGKFSALKAEANGALWAGGMGDFCVSAFIAGASGPVCRKNKYEAAGEDGGTVELGADGKRLVNKVTGLAVDSDLHGAPKKRVIAGVVFHNAEAEDPGNPSNKNKVPRFVSLDRKYVEVRRPTFETVNYTDAANKQSVSMRVKVVQGFQPDGTPVRMYQDASGRVFTVQKGPTSVVEKDVPPTAEDWALYNARKKSFESSHKPGDGRPVNNQPTSCINCHAAPRNDQFNAGAFGGQGFGGTNFGGSGRGGFGGFDSKAPEPPKGRKEKTVVEGSITRYDAPASLTKDAMTVQSVDITRTLPSGLRVKTNASMGVTAGGNGRLLTYDNRYAPMSADEVAKLKPDVRAKYEAQKKDFVSMDLMSHNATVRVGNNGYSMALADGKPSKNPGAVAGAMDPTNLNLLAYVNGGKTVTIGPPAANSTLADSRSVSYTHYETYTDADGNAREKSVWDRTRWLEFSDKDKSVTVKVKEPSKDNPDVIITKEEKLTQGFAIARKAAGLGQNPNAFMALYDGGWNSNELPSANEIKLGRYSKNTVELPYAVKLVTPVPPRPGDLGWLSVDERDDALFGRDANGHNHLTFNDEPDKGGKARVSFDIRIDRSGLSESQLRERYRKAATYIADWDTSREAGDPTKLDPSSFPKFGSYGAFQAPSKADLNLAQACPSCHGASPSSPVRLDWEPSKLKAAPLRYIDSANRGDFIDLTTEHMTQMSLWDGSKPNDALDVSFSFGGGGSIATSFTYFDQKEYKVKSRMPEKGGMVYFMPLPEGAPPDADGAGDAENKKRFQQQWAYGVSIAAGRKAVLGTMKNFGTDADPDWRIDGFMGAKDGGGYGWKEYSLSKGTKDDGHWYWAGDEWREIYVDGKLLNGGGKKNGVVIGTTWSVWNFPEKTGDLAGNYVQFQVCDDPYSTGCSIAVGIVKAGVTMLVDPKTYLIPAAFKGVQVLKGMKLTSDFAKWSVRGLEAIAWTGDKYFKFEMAKGAVEGTVNLTKAVFEEDKIKRSGLIVNGVNAVASTAGMHLVTTGYSRWKTGGARSVGEPSGRKPVVENLPSEPTGGGRETAGVSGNGNKGGGEVVVNNEGAGRSGGENNGGRTFSENNAGRTFSENSGGGRMNEGGRTGGSVENTGGSRRESGGGAVVENNGGSKRTSVAENRVVESPRTDSMAKSGGGTSRIDVNVGRALAGGPAGDAAGFAGKGTGTKNFSGSGGAGGVVRPGGFKAAAVEKAGAGAGKEASVHEAPKVEPLKFAEQKLTNAKENHQAKQIEADAARTRANETFEASRRADAEMARKQNEVQRANKEFEASQKLVENRPSEANTRRFEAAEARRELAGRELAEARGKSETARAEREVAKRESAEKVADAREAKKLVEGAEREVVRAKDEASAVKEKETVAEKTEKPSEKAAEKPGEKASEKPAEKPGEKVAEKKTREERKHDDSVRKDQAERKLAEAKDARLEAKQNERAAVENSKRAKAEETSARENAKSARVEADAADSHAKAAEAKADALAKEKGESHADVVEARREAELAREDATAARMRSERADVRVAEASAAAEAAGRGVAETSAKRAEAETAVAEASGEAGVGVWGKIKDAARRGVESADAFMGARQKTAADPTRTGSVERFDAAVARAYASLPRPMRAGLGVVRGIGVRVERFGAAVDRGLAKLLGTPIDPVSGLPADHVKIKVRGEDGKLRTELKLGPDGKPLLQPRPAGFFSGMIIEVGHLLQGRLTAHPGEPLGDYETARWPKLSDRPSFKKALTAEARSAGEVVGRVDLATGKIEYGAKGETPAGHVDISFQLGERKGRLEITGVEPKGVGADLRGPNMLDAVSMAQQHVSHALQGTLDLPRLRSSLRESLLGTEVQGELFKNRDPLSGQSYAKLHYDPATRTLKTKPSKGSVEVVLEVSVMSGDGRTFRVTRMGAKGLDLKVSANLRLALERPMKLSPKVGESMLYEPSAGGAKRGEAVLAESARKRAELAELRKAELGRQIADLRGEIRAKREAGLDASGEYAQIRELLDLERARREGATSLTGADGRGYKMLRRDVGEGALNESLFGREVVKQTRQESCTLATLADMVNQARERTGVKAEPLGDQAVLADIGKVLGKETLAKVEAEFKAEGGLTKATLDAVLPALAREYGFSLAKRPVKALLSEALPNGETVGVVVNEAGVGPHMVSLKAHVDAQGRKTGLVEMADPALMGKDGRARSILRTYEQVAELLTGRDGFMLKDLEAAPSLKPVLPGKGGLTPRLPGGRGRVAEKAGTGAGEKDPAAGAKSVEEYSKLRGIPEVPYAWKHPDLSKPAELTLWKAQFVDPLTGLLNARYYKAAKGKLVNEYHEVVMMDGDSFGSVDRALRGQFDNAPAPASGTRKKIAGLDSPEMQKLMNDALQPTDRAVSKDEAMAMVKEAESLARKGRRMADEVLARMVNNVKASAEMVAGPENVAVVRMGGEEIALFVKGGKGTQVAEAGRRAGRKFHENNLELADITKRPEFETTMSAAELMKAIKAQAVNDARTKAEAKGEKLTPDAEIDTSRTVGTISLGVSRMDPHGTRNPHAVDEALYKADEALEHSKGAGKDAVTLALTNGKMKTLERIAEGVAAEYARETPDYSTRREELSGASAELLKLDPKIHEKFVHESSLDAKTGVYDAEALHRDVPQLLAKYDHVLVLHIDNFKRINNLGHAAGDAALKAMGDVLINRFGANKEVYAARSQSKEFVLVGSKEALIDIARKMDTYLRREKPIQTEIAKELFKTEKPTPEQVQQVHDKIVAEAVKDGKNPDAVGTATYQPVEITAEGPKARPAFDAAVQRAFEAIEARTERNTLVAQGKLPTRLEKLGTGSGEPVKVNLEEFGLWNDKGSQGDIFRKPGSSELVKVFRFHEAATGRGAVESLVRHNDALIADGLAVAPMEVVDLGGGRFGVKTRLVEGKNLGLELDRLWEDPATRTQALALQQKAEGMISRIDEVSGLKADRRRGKTADIYENFVLTAEGRLVNVDPLNMRMILMGEGVVVPAGPKTVALKYASGDKKGAGSGAKVDGELVAAPFVSKAYDFARGDKASRVYNKTALPGLEPSGGQLAAKAKALKAKEASLNADVIGEPGGRAIETQTLGDCGVRAMFNDPGMAPVRAVFEALAKEQATLFGSKVTPYDIFLKFSENVAGRKLTQGTHRFESSAIAEKLGLELEFRETVRTEADLKRYLIENGGAMQADFRWREGFASKDSRHAVVIDGAFRESGVGALPAAIKANGVGRTLKQMFTEGPISTLKKLSSEGVWKYVVVDSNFPHPRTFTFGELSALGLKGYSLRPEVGVFGARLTPHEIAGRALKAWNESLSPADRSAGAGQIDVKFRTLGGERASAAAIVGHEGPITATTAGGTLIKVHKVGDGYVVESPAGREALPKIGSLTFENVMIGQANGRLIFQAVSGEAGLVHFERKATESKTAVTLEAVGLPKEKLGTGAGDAWTSAYEAALAKVSQDTGIPKERLRGAVDEFHRSEGYSAREIATNQSQLERHIAGLAKRLPSETVATAPKPAAATEAAPVLPPLGEAQISGAKASNFNAALPAIIDGKRAWLKMSQYRGVEPGPDHAVRLRKEAETTAAVHRDLNNPAKAPNKPMPAGFVVPEVLGFGKAPKSIKTSGDAAAMALSDIPGKSIDGYFDFKKGYAGKARLTTGDFLALENGLARLHELGWTHGDLNPGNIILVEQGGRVKLGLIDWQPAKRREALGREEFEARVQGDREQLASLKADLLGDGFMVEGPPTRETSGTGAGVEPSRLKPSEVEKLSKDVRLFQALPESIKIDALSDPSGVKVQKAHKLGEIAGTSAVELGLLFADHGVRISHGQKLVRLVLEGFPLDGYHSAFHPLEVARARVREIVASKKEPTRADLIDVVAHLLHDSVGETRLKIAGEVAQPPTVSETLRFLQREDVSGALREIGLTDREIVEVGLLIEKTFYSDNQKEIPSFAEEIYAKREAAVDWNMIWKERVRDFCIGEPACMADIEARAQKLGDNDKGATYFGEPKTMFERVDGLRLEQGKGVIQIFDGTAWFLKNMLAKNEGFQAHLDRLTPEYRKNFEQSMELAVQLDGLAKIRKLGEDGKPVPMTAAEARLAVETFFAPKREFFRERGVDTAKLEADVLRELETPAQRPSVETLASQFKDYHDMASQSGLLRDGSDGVSPLQHSLDLFFESRNTFTPAEKAMLKVELEKRWKAQVLGDSKSVRAPPKPSAPVAEKVKDFFFGDPANRAYQMRSIKELPYYYGAMLRKIVPFSAKIPEFLPGSTFKSLASRVKKLASQQLPGEAPRVLGEIRDKPVEVQTHSDCAVRAAYNHPSLEPVRKALESQFRPGEEGKAYDLFLDLAESISGERLRKEGTSSSRKAAFLREMGYELREAPLREEADLLAQLEDGGAAFASIKFRGSKMLKWIGDHHSAHAVVIEGAFRETGVAALRESVSERGLWGTIKEARSRGGLLKGLKELMGEGSWKYVVVDSNFPRPQLYTFGELKRAKFQIETVRPLVDPAKLKPLTRDQITAKVLEAKAKFEGVPAAPEGRVTRFLNKVLRRPEKATASESVALSLGGDGRSEKAVLVRSADNVVIEAAGMTFNVKWAKDGKSVTFMREGGTTPVEIANGYEMIAGSDAKYAGYAKPDSALSPRHLRIEVSGDMLIIEDLGSHTGTRVEYLRQVNAPKELGKSDGQTLIVTPVRGTPEAGGATLPVPAGLAVTGRLAAAGPRTNVYEAQVGGQPAILKINAPVHEAGVLSEMNAVPLPADNVFIPKMLGSEPATPEARKRLDPQGKIPESEWDFQIEHGAHIMAVEPLPAGYVSLFDHFRKQSPAPLAPISAKDWAGLVNSVEALHAKGLGFGDFNNVTNILIKQEGGRTFFALIDTGQGTRLGLEKKNKQAKGVIADDARDLGILANQLVAAGALPHDWRQALPARAPGERIGVGAGEDWDGFTLDLGKLKQSDINIGGMSWAYDRALVEGDFVQARRQLRNLEGYLKSRAGLNVLYEQKLGEIAVLREKVDGLAAKQVSEGIDRSKTTLSPGLDPSKAPLLSGPVKVVPADMPMVLILAKHEHQILWSVAEHRASRIAQDSLANQDVLNGAEDMIQKKVDGHPKPGMEVKHTGFGNIRYMRHRKGARVFYRDLPGDRFEVVAISDKANEDRVFKLLNDLYGK